MFLICIKREWLVWAAIGYALWWFVFIEEADAFVKWYKGQFVIFNCWWPTVLQQHVIHFSVAIKHFLAPIYDYFEIGRHNFSLKPYVPKHTRVYHANRVIYCFISISFCISMVVSYYVFKFIRVLRRNRAMSDLSFWSWNKLARYPYYYKIRFILLLIIPVLVSVGLWWPHITHWVFTQDFLNTPRFAQLQAYQKYWWCYHKYKAFWSPELYVIQFALAVWVQRMWLKLSSGKRRDVWWDYFWATRRAYYFIRDEDERFRDRILHLTKTLRMRHRNRHYRSIWNDILVDSPFPYGWRKEDRERPIQERIDEGKHKLDGRFQVKKTRPIADIKREYNAYWKKDYQQDIYWTY